MLSFATGLSQGYPSLVFSFIGSWFRSDLGFYTLEKGKVPGEKADVKAIFSFKFSI